MEPKSKSSTMFCGIPVEKGTFIFAIVNAVICSLLSLGSLGFFISSLNPWFDGESRGPNDMVLVYLITGIAVACCVGTAVALTFAVVLVVGVKNSNTRYLLAYLIYGICIEVLSVVGCIAFLVTSFTVWTLIPLGVCVIYSLILVLVFQTRVVFSERKPPTHIRLLNTNDS